MAHKPGDRVKVRWGLSIQEGVVTSVNGNWLHIDLDIEGADDPVPVFFPDDELIDA
jgi:hypothetical protein